ncbi:hypothetical protein ACWER9_27940 [Micromonospora sp. NPDC003944]
MDVTVGAGGNGAPERHRRVVRADRPNSGGAGRTDGWSLIIASAGLPT